MAAGTRWCAIERGVDSCAQYSDYACDIVSHLMSDRFGVLIFLHNRLKNITEAEYNLCLRQSENMPNIVRLLIKAGKQLAWAARLDSARA